ncbi:MAG: 3-methyl-2-oxobutanoate dehydrogenase subunit VorB [Thermosulfidibacteraceae bacterium]|jgi:2-oxoglutarate ferredoxin oxidoreductase subunit alpha
MKRLWKGCDAIAEAAIQAGCRFFAGYPITPQSQILEYMSWRMPEVGGVFIQSESELAAINIVMGASIAGVRAMTASSSPGISLMQEGISYLAGMELPAVIVNVNRGGPGLGGIQPNQGDYFQSTKGGGHGDYRTFVFAPHTVQESVRLVFEAFRIADEYRNPVIIHIDGIIAQMMESVEIDPSWYVPPPEKKWALTGCAGREPQIIKSLYLGPGELTDHDWKLAKKYESMKKEVKWEEYAIGEDEELELLVVAFGTAARVAKGAIKELKSEGVKIGLFRPITLFPYPEEPLRSLSNRSKRIVVVEMNTGQMLEDVERITRRDLYFIGKPSDVFYPDELYGKFKNLVGV